MARLMPNDTLHKKYVSLCSTLLPHQYTSEELNHISLANFVLSSSELLGSLLTPDVRESHRNWQYLHLVGSGTGFRGSLSASLPKEPASKYDAPYLPATYFSLSNLLLLGDDFSRLDGLTLLQEIKSLQNGDGSFSATRLKQECDLRYSYMAIAVRFMLLSTSKQGLSDAPDIDVVAAKSFIQSCFTMDGAYAQLPGAEAHAGLTFCALAALTLLDSTPTPAEQSELLDWLLARHNTDGGMNGRVGKESDVCYCYWVASSLQMLDYSGLLDTCSLEAYVATCQSRIGGYAKVPEAYPDIYHTYLGLAIGGSLGRKTRISCALSLPLSVLGPHSR